MCWWLVARVVVVGLQLMAGKQQQQQRGRWLTALLPPSLPSRPVSLRPPISPLCSVWQEGQSDVTTKDLVGVGGALAWKRGRASGKCIEHMGFWVSRYNYGEGEPLPDYGAHC